METNIGILEQVSGHTYDTIYDLLFTSERVIAFVIHHPTDAPFKFGVTEFFFGGQMGKHSERIERRRVAEERRRLYKEKALDELITSHRSNFEIPYRAVTSVELTRGLFHSRLKFHISWPSNVRRTIHFTFAKDQFINARHLLDLVLPSKVKGK
jgi:hypothetical protein